MPQPEHNDADINALLSRFEQRLAQLQAEQRLAEDSLPAFRELADELERRSGPADRRQHPRGTPDRRHAS